MLTVITPRDLHPEAVAFMIKHGCTIKTYEMHNVVTFPEGTVREEIFPRTSHGTRFTLLLPDGCLMRQTFIRYLEQSVLYYPKDCTCIP